MPIASTNQSAAAGPSRRGLLRNIGVNAVLPYVTYILLTKYGVAIVPALLASAVFPAAETVFGIVSARRVEALGIIVLTATAASMVSALWFVSPFLLLAKGSLITGFIGLVFLVSLACRRPLIFYLASTGMDQAARDAAEMSWHTQPGYRMVMRRLTAFWAVAMIAEASLRLVLIPLLPIAIFLPISEAMWIVFFAGMTAWSWRYGARMRARLTPQPISVPS